MLSLKMLGLTDLPDFSNRFYLIRSLRLASAFFIDFIINRTLNLEPYESLAFFLGLLILAISDRVGPIQKRLKFSFSLILSVVLLALIQINLINPLGFYGIFFIPVLVFLALRISHNFRQHNFYFTGMLLAYAFFIPTHLEMYGSFEFVLFLFLGGLLFIITMLFGYGIYYYFEYVRKNDQEAELFFMDHEMNAGDTKILNTRKEAKELAQKEIGRWNFFSHPIRLTISMILAFIVMYYSPYSQSYWIMMTVILLHNPSKKISAGIPKIVQRFLGTVVGLILSYFIMGLHASEGLYIGVTFVSSFMIFMTIKDNYFIAVAFITLLLINGVYLSGRYSGLLLEERFLDTLVSILIILGVHASLLGLKKVLKL